MKTPTVPVHLRKHNHPSRLLHSITHSTLHLAVKLQARRLDSLAMNHLLYRDRCRYISRDRDDHRVQPVPDWEGHKMRGTRCQVKATRLIIGLGAVTEEGVHRGSKGGGIRRIFIGIVGIKA